MACDYQTQSLKSATTYNANTKKKLSGSGKNTATIMYKKFKFDSNMPFKEVATVVWRIQKQITEIKLRKKKVKANEIVATAPTKVRKTLVWFQ